MRHNPYYNFIIIIIYFYLAIISLYTGNKTFTKLQTRFQKSWDNVQIVNKKGMQ